MIPHGRVSPLRACASFPPPHQLCCVLWVLAPHTLCRRILLLPCPGVPSAFPRHIKPPAHPSDLGIIPTNYKNYPDRQDAL